MLGKKISKIVVKKKMPVSGKANTGIPYIGVIRSYDLTMQSTGQTDTHWGESK
jgi:hypothetical protein